MLCFKNVCTTHQCAKSFCTVMFISQVTSLNLCQVTTHVNWALLCAMPWLSAKKSMVRRRLYSEELTTTIGQLDTENHQLQENID